MGGKDLVTRVVSPIHEHLMEILEAQIEPLTPETIHAILIPAQVCFEVKTCLSSAILIEEEVVPTMDSSTKRSAVASLLVLQ